MQRFLANCVFRQCRFLTRSSNNDFSLGTLLTNGALSNFQLQSEGRHSASLVQKPIHYPMPIPFQYGGDIAANFILAAETRLPALSTLRLMSLNIEFVNSGDYSQPRSYNVKSLSESGRFVHTNINLIQNNLAVAVGNVIFHGPEDAKESLSYYPPFPKDCGMLDDLPDDDKVVEKLKAESSFGKSTISNAEHSVALARGFGLVSRPCDPGQYFHYAKEPSTRLSFWIRITDKDAEAIKADLEHQNWQLALLAYISGYRITGSALAQNPSFIRGKLLMLSHSIWFSPKSQMASFTDWILHDTRVKMSDNNTVICEGYLWNEKKELLAICQQQALLKPAE